MSHPVRMLLIDDDPSIVRLLSAILKKHFGDRMLVASTTDANQALEIISASVPDIVITDLEMPITDGLDVLRCAKNRNPWTQVIMLTGHSSTMSLLAAMESGASDYLLKPVDEAPLIQLLEEAYARVERWRAALHGSMAAKK